LKGEQETINVTLQEEVGALEEVVVAGYGTQQRQEVSGSVSSVDAADANVGQIESPQDLLQGRVPGLSIAGNDGEPGSDQRVRVRGLKSLSANSQPLYVIDGSPVRGYLKIPDWVQFSRIGASSYGH
jgi:iron complex outermembrane receptor protein